MAASHQNNRQSLAKLLLIILPMVGAVSLFLSLSIHRIFFLALGRYEYANDDHLHDVQFDTARSKNHKHNYNEQLNILLFYPDDWRHDSIGSEKPYVHTPFLTQLANEGIRFTQNAVTTSVCWMSRATLFSGQYASRHKSYKLACPEFTKRENWKHTWVSMLRTSGYYVGHVGKWQYRSDAKPDFDYHSFFGGFHWLDLDCKGRMVHGTDLAKTEALRFFDQRPKDKPFALEIMFYPPKPIGDTREPGSQFEPTNETRKIYDNISIPEPVSMNTFHQLPMFIQKGRTAQARFYNRYRTPQHFQESMKNYYALITHVDQACKEIVQKLKEEGLYNNTMIIFTTDNGMFHGSHGLAGKWYPYQESIRVPLIIYDPRMPKEKRGTLDDSFTLNIDLAETILGAAGIKPPEVMQGRDISDLYLPSKDVNDIHNSTSLQKEPWRTDFFYEFQYDNDKSIPSSTALVEKEWKYIHWPRLFRSGHDHGYEQLFNLARDPLEMDDLFNDTEAHPVLQRMRKRHDELRKALHDSNYINGPCYTGAYVSKENSTDKYYNKCDV